MDKDFFKQADESSRQYIILFFKNVDYLLKKRYKTISEGVRILSERGFKVSEGYIEMCKNGEIYDCELDTWVEWSNALEVPLQEMLGKDLGKDLSWG
jgi:hypothetical protein